jgi:hypothetical protein
LLYSSFLFFPLAELQFFAFLGRCEYPAEGRGFVFMSLDCRWRRLDTLNGFLELNVEGQLKLEVIRHDELKLLANWSITC